MDIRLEGVAKRYGDTDVVADLDLRLASGRVVALLGPSGCGKTTTLRMMAGLERLSRGRLWLGDTLVDDAGSTFVPPEGRGLGMVFQSYALWPHKSVADNVAYPLSLRGIGGTQRRDLAMAGLERVRLAHLADRMPHQLSGGQQQRVAVARAVVGDGVHSPPILLLDEPLANLDAKLREEMRGELSTLARTSGATVVAVTHDQQEAFAIADDVVVLNQGRLAQQGSPEDIYLRPNTPFVGAFGGPMYFVPATLDVDEVRVGETRIPRRDVHVGGGVGNGPISLGVRPEWLRTGVADGVDVVVLQRLFLGREHELRVTVTSTSTTLLLRWPSLTPPPAIGDHFQVLPTRAVAFSV